MAKFTITLDMYKGPRVGEPVFIRVGDKSTCEVSATITEDGVDKVLDGLQARFECFKPDGRMVISEPFDVSGSTIEYAMPEQVSLAEGRISLAYFALIDGEGHIDTTQSFEIIVEPGVDGGDLSSSDYIGDIDAILRLLEAQRRSYEEAEQGRATAEDGRVEAEQGRVEAEAARVAAEAQRAENDKTWNANEETRKANEASRVEAEAARAAAEEARASAEADRKSSEAARDTAEAERKEAETARGAAEKERASAEASRASEESKRAEAEAGRVTAEQARAEAETEREGAEAERSNAESARKAAETARADAEAERAAAEAARKEAEAARVAAEEARAAAESARAAAEEARAAAQADRDARQDKNDEDQAKNNADQAANNSAALGMSFVILTTGQYDPDTLEPTVSGENGKMYLVPDPKGGEDDVYSEWIWIPGTSSFEHMGSTTTNFDPMTTADVDAVASDQSPSGDRTMNVTSLSYFWTKLKGAFAALSHKHAKADITDFPASMPASDVYAWAKAEAKPAYTAQEVGAAPASHTHAVADVTGLSDTIAGLQTRSTYATVTIQPGDWSGMACTKQVEGVTAESVVRCGADPSCEIAASEAHVYCSAQGAGTLSFACVTVPTVAVTLSIEIWEA